jgi:hypothetical protein
VLLGNGDGSFQTTNLRYVTERSPTSVAVADLNGDGRPDLAVANYFSNDVSILLNDGIWSGPQPGPGGGAPRSGRFSGDGAGVSKRPGAGHPAAVVEAPLAEAAIPDLRPTAPAVSAIDLAQMLPPRDSARPAPVTTPPLAPRREEPPPPTHRRSAARMSPTALLDLIYTDALAPASDGNLVGDRGPLLA